MLTVAVETELLGPSSVEFRVTIRDLIKKNFERLLIEIGMSQKEVAARFEKEGKEEGDVGVDPSYISQLFSQDRLTLKAIGKLAKAMGVEESDLVRPLHITPMEEDHAFVSLYNVKAANGLMGIVAGDYPEEQERLPFKRRWLKKLGIGSPERISKLAVIRASGDSMHPTINDTEVILVDLDDSARIPDNVKNGSVYVIRWGVAQDELSVKRLHFDWAARTVIATSDNPLWDKKPIVLREDQDLRELVLGKVMWVGKEKI
jgi:transcriptional regulator with XRE-family HTH domain